MFEYVFYAYVAAIGFCTAGIAASLSQMITGKPLGFGLGSVHAGSTLLGVLTRVLAGPAIVMRNAVKAAFRGRPPYWLVFSTLISVVWSFFSGVVVVELLFRFSSYI
ncbi:MAG: hypothetical protein OEM91_10030 [Hyphomicrobiales bacterium]|nr:hypothetical protein [Hyphomicrobiales bacterium]